MWRDDETIRHFANYIGPDRVSGRDNGSDEIARLFRVRLLETIPGAIELIGSNIPWNRRCLGTTNDAAS